MVEVRKAGVPDAAGVETKAEARGAARDRDRAWVVVAAVGDRHPATERSVKPCQVETEVVRWEWDP